MVNLGVSTGAVLLGIVFNAVLYGLLIMQTYEYSLTCFKDPRWVKCLVAVLFLLDTLNTGLGISHLYYLFVTHFGEMDAINGSTWMINTDPIITAIISALVQLFFAYRVLRLTRNKWVFSLILLTTLAQTVGGIVCTVQLSSIKGTVDLMRLRTGVIIWLSCAVATDILIAGSLSWYLHRSKTGFAITDDIIARIIRVTLQTGLLTTVCATIDLALYLAVPNDLHLFFNFILCKLYTNSLLSSLNARSRWESSSRSKSSHGQIPGPSGRVGTLYGHGRNGDGTMSRGLSVQVHQTIDVIEDHRQSDYQHGIELQTTRHKTTTMSTTHSTSLAEDDSDLKCVELPSIATDSRSEDPRDVKVLDSYA